MSKPVSKSGDIASTVIASVVAAIVLLPIAALGLGLAFRAFWWGVGQ